MATNRKRRGIASVWVVLSMTLLIACVGLACDVAYTFLVALQLQNAADAAALGSGRYARSDSIDLARAQAQFVALANRAGGRSVCPDLNEQNLPDGNIILGRYYRQTRTFEPTLTRINAIKSVTSRPDSRTSGGLPLFWGPIFGVRTVPITRHAIAINLGGIGAALICLDPDDRRALRINGNPILNIPEGSVWVNSTNRLAIDIVGNPVLDVTDVCVSHDYTAEDSPIGSNATFEGNLWSGMPQIDDPLASLGEYMKDYLSDNPLSAQEAKTVPSGSDVTIQPGYYPDGINMHNGRLTLESGVYLLGGDGLQVNGGDFIAEGVYIYILDDSKKTQVKLTGNGEIRITAMPYVGDGDPPYEGVAIHQDVDNDNAAIINGNDQTYLEGTLYTPGAHITLTGTAQAFGTQVIAATAELSGNGTFNINYDGRFTGRRYVFLVE